MLDILKELYQRQAIRAIDYQFACFIAGNEQPAFADAMAAWAALASFELGKGNVCVDLSELDPSSLLGLKAKESAEIAEILKPGSAGNWLLEASVVGDGSGPTPMVFDGQRLYLSRYWHAEQKVATEINKRTVAVPLPPSMDVLLDTLFAPDFALLGKFLPQWPQAMRREKLADFFDVVDPAKVDWDGVLANIDSIKTPSELAAYLPVSACLNWQKVAAAVALSYRFSVISGGPGTGKTTTVAKLLASLVAGGGNTPPEIKLVAPTGKAANRLTESIGRAVAALPVSAEIREQIPVQASTIHRLLGAIPNRVEFRHHAGNRLHLDILVVDEASMVDLPMMARLLSALPDHARILLLGDRDQLASVEAGAVLGDICAMSESGYSADRAKALSALTGFNLAAGKQQSAVGDSLCLLRKSYRFHANSGIGQLAYAINNGNTPSVRKVLANGFSDIRLHDLDGEEYQELVNQAVEGYRTYLLAMKNGDSAKTVLDLFAGIRVLCAVTEGPFGVAGLNRAIEKILAGVGAISPGDENWYLGRPVMITQNDHGLGLYNGDIGIVMEEEGSHKVFFEMADGTIRSLLPSRLPEHQTAFAMTIHKSQGSEFDHTIMVLPPTPSPVVTRELVYTGVTRAKTRLDLYATRPSLERGVRQKTQRYSGLSSALS